MSKTKLSLFFIFIFILSLNSAFANKSLINLNCMSNSLIQSTLNQRDINIAVSTCSDELKQKLQPFNSPELITYDAIELILAMVIAHNTAPYGWSNLKSNQYEDLIKAGKLNCATYAILMGYLLLDKNIYIIGFDGGEVGNHAQVIYENKNLSLLLDPTVSTIALVTYDSLLQGKPIKHVITIHPNPKNDSEIKDYFTEKVVSALREGKYKPSNILYYYESLNHMLGKGPLDPFITPGGVSWRNRKPFNTWNNQAIFIAHTLGRTNT
jgi:hypothetical protein